MITGVGIGIHTLTAIVILPKYFLKLRPLAMGISVSGAGVGTFLFPFVIDKLIFYHGWRYSFVVIGIIFLISVIFGVAFKPVNKIESKTVNFKNKVRIISLRILKFSLKFLLTRYFWKDIFFENKIFNEKEIFNKKKLYSFKIEF